MDDNDTPPMARPRVAAGALFFDNQDCVLLVKPTYKNGWDIPGGYVEPGETPQAACSREIREELGLTAQIDTLLVVDWAPHPQEGDKILFVFSGGLLPQSTANDIRLATDELEDWGMFDAQQLSEQVPPRLARRLTRAMDAHHTHTPLYLQHGTPLRE